MQAAGTSCAGAYAGQTMTMLTATDRGKTMLGTPFIPPANMRSAHQSSGEQWNQPSTVGCDGSERPSCCFDSSSQVNLWVQHGQSTYPDFLLENETAVPPAAS